MITSGTSTSITGTAFLYGANLGPTNGEYATITGSVVNGSGTMTYADSGPQPNPASGGATSAGVNNVADVTTGGGAVSSFYLVKELDGYGPTPTTLAACNADPYCGEAQYTNTGASAGSDLSASVALTQSNGQPFVGGGASSVGQTLIATVTLSAAAAAMAPITGITVDPSGLTVSPAAR